MTPILTLRTDHPLVSQRADFSCGPTARNLEKDHTFFLSETTGPPRSQHSTGPPLTPSHCDPPATPACFLCPLLQPPIHYFCSWGDRLHLGHTFSLSDYRSVCLRVWQSLPRLASLHWHIFLSPSLAGWEVLRGLHCILLIITLLCYAVPITWCTLVNVCRTDELINQPIHTSLGP